MTARHDFYRVRTAKNRTRLKVTIQRIAWSGIETALGNGCRCRNIIKEAK